MNIFILDTDPTVAAQYQLDKHVVKMVLETAQILSTISGKGYKPTHKNHPCVKWAGESKANFDWLVTHGLALSDEYAYRYGKVHKSRAVIELCSTHELENNGLTTFAQAMPDEYRNNDVVEAYRAYYHSKREFARWTKRSPPFWWSVTA